MRPTILKADDVAWSAPPGHRLSALSRLLIRPETSDTKSLDFRISSYAPGGYSEPHVHERSENLFFFLEGRGTMELDGEQHAVEQGMVVFVPPGVHHGVRNTGDRPLKFVFVASAPDDMPL